MKYIYYIYNTDIGGSSRVQCKPAHVYGSKTKEKKEERGRGHRRASSRPQGVGPSPTTQTQTTPSVDPATPQRNTAACSSTHDPTTAPRARAQGPKFRIHTHVDERWCWCHGSGVVSQTRQHRADRQRPRRIAILNEKMG